MNREEALNFAIEVAREEYVRNQGRLALIETKAQLIAVTAGVFVTVLVTYGIDKLPLNSPGLGLIAGMTILSLVTALVFSLSASMFLEVTPPPTGTRINAKVEELLVSRTSNSNPDAAKAEDMLREQAAAYALAAGRLADAINERIRKLKIAQIALLFSLVLIFVWMGLPALGASIGQFNGGT